MPVIRIEKNTNYTTMSNYHLRDANLSLKAKGLMSLFLSLPDNWQYSIQGLTHICKEGRSGITTALKELEANGYLVRERRRDAQGLLRDITYVIYEKPQRPEAEADPEKRTLDAPMSKNQTFGEDPAAEKLTLEDPKSENPALVSPAQEKPAPENQAQSSKDRTSKDPSSKDGKRGERLPRRRYGTYGNVLLSDADLAALQAEFPFDWQQRLDRLSEYMASSGKVYKNHLATIRVWAKQDRARPRKYSHDIYQCGEGDSL